AGMPGAAASGVDPVVRLAVVAENHVPFDAEPTEAAERQVPRRQRIPGTDPERRADECQEDQKCARTPVLPQAGETTRARARLDHGCFPLSNPRGRCRWRPRSYP